MLILGTDIFRRTWGGKKLFAKNVQSAPGSDAVFTLDNGCGAVCKAQGQVF